MVEMSLSSSVSLQLYTGPLVDAAEPSALDPTTSGLAPTEREWAERLACRETWRPYPSRKLTSKFEPYSLGWYEEIEKRRYSRHGRWIPKLFEFNRHRGDHVLCLGEGIGTDCVQFALDGAAVDYCSPSAETLSLVQHQFQLRGLSGEFQRGAFTALPFANDSKDVVCLSAMAEPIEPLGPVIAEIFRVLKPGGKLLAALPAKYNSSFWKSVWFPWRRLFTEQPEDSAHYSCRRVKLLFASFSEPRIFKRHLRRSDIPHIWRWMLLPLLERIMGRYLVLKTFKPVGAGLALRLAA
jgi:SAM-dependent methyltransferase